MTATLKSILVFLFVLTPQGLWAQSAAEEVETRLSQAEAQLARDPARSATLADEVVAALETVPEGERDPPAQVSALELSGRAYLAAGDVETALARFRASLKLAREIGEARGIADNLLAIGKIHLAAGRLRAAAATLERAREAAAEIDSPPLRLAGSAALAETYAAQGRYREAYAAQQQAAELEGTASAESTSAAVGELEQQLEVLRQQHEVALEERQRELDALRDGTSAAQTQLLAAAAVAGVLLVLWLATLLSRRRLREHLSRQLADRDRELQASSTHLDQTTAELEHTTDMLEQTALELRRAKLDLERSLDEARRATGERDTARDELDAVRFDLGRAASELEQARAELARLEAALGDAVTVRDRNSVQLAQTSSELEQSSQQLRRTAAKLEQTRAELERQKASYAQDVAALGDRNAVTRERLGEMEGFTSAVSQHLKVLLISIRSSLGALQQDAVAGDLDQLRDDVHRTHHAVGRVVSLLDKLLKLLLIGRIVGAPSEISMSELAFEAVGQVPGLSDRRAEIVIAPVMPVVSGDRTQLLEVLRNLLENAGKFMGDQPAPKIEVGTRRDDGDDGSPRTVYFVRDNGIGIDARDHERIFTLFERLNPEKEGVGLGLGLVQRILSAHDGRIWVESEGRGHGSTFCFTL